MKRSMDRTRRSSQVSGELTMCDLDDELRKLREAKNPYRDFGPRDPLWLMVLIYSVMIGACVWGLTLLPH
jgi:hypothetical protein